MSSSALRTTTLPVIPVPDDLIVNGNGTTGRIPTESLIALITARLGPAWETRAELLADLDWPDGAVGAVFGDANEALNGQYRKSGASGAGTWTRIGPLQISSATVAQLAAKASTADLQVERDERQADLVTLEARQSDAADRLARYQTALAQTPALSAFNVLADFTRKAYATIKPAAIVGGHFDVLDMRAAQPANGGLVIDPDALDTNLCHAALNDTDGSRWKASDVAITAVAVADLPEGPRSYFEGLTLDGQPVRHVFRAVNTSGGTKTVRPYCNNVVSGDVYALSAYCWGVSGSFRLSLSNAQPYSDNITLGGGARASTVATATAANAILTLRLTNNTEAYFAAPQFERAAAPSAYILSRMARNAVQLFDKSLIGPGRLLMRVSLPAALPQTAPDSKLMQQKDDSNQIKAELLMNWDKMTVQFRIITAAGLQVVVGAALGFAPDREVIIAVEWDANGTCALCVNGGNIDRAKPAGAIDITALNRMTFGGENAGSQGNPLPNTFTDMTINQIAWEAAQ